MTARLVGLAYPLLLLGAALILMALLAMDGRRVRRQDAQRAEQRARPPDIRPTDAIRTGLPAYHATAHRITEETDHA